MDYITLQISPTAFNAGQPLAALNPAYFSLNLPLKGTIIPSLPVRDPRDPNQGGAHQVIIRPSTGFTMDAQVFAALVENFATGSYSTFITSICDFVDRGILIVYQDEGSPLTVNQILNYVAP